MKNNEDLIRKLTELGRSYDKEGYSGDACFKYFQANVLKFCEELVESFKGIEKQMKYMWQTLDELKEENPRVSSLIKDPKLKEIAEKVENGKSN